MMPLCTWRIQRGTWFSCETRVFFNLLCNKAECTAPDGTATGKTNVNAK